MVVSNVTDGIGVAVVCDKNNIVHRKNFTGSSFSSFDTNQLWVENLQDSNFSAGHLLLLPLENKIGLLYINYTRETNLWSSQLSTRQLQEVEGYNCWLLFIQRVLNVLYAFCNFLTTTSSRMQLYELSISSLQQPGEVHLETYATSDGHFTNVAYVKSGRISEDFYYVRDSRYITIITPANYNVRNEYDLSFIECSNLSCNSLVYAPPDSIIIHCQCCDEICEPRGVLYDIHQANIQSHGKWLLYNCPDDETIVNVTRNTFTISGTAYNLTGQGFRQGLCSGNSSAFWFAYQDNNGHIYAANISPSSNLVLHNISKKGCLQYPGCSPIKNMSDYLVIQEFDTDSGQIIAKVIQPSANFSVIFEVRNSHSGFFAQVVVLSRIAASSTVANTVASSFETHLPFEVTSINPSLTYSQPLMTSPYNSTAVNDNILVKIIVPCCIAAVLLIVIIGPILVWYMKYRRTTGRLKPKHSQNRTS